MAKDLWISNHKIYSRFQKMCAVSMIKPTRGQNVSEGPLLWADRAESILHYWFCFGHSELMSFVRTVVIFL